jgi:DnaK suppressor protein
MTHSRQAELRTMLEERRSELEAQMLQKIRSFRDKESLDVTRPAVDLSDDPAHEDLDFALVQIQGETMERIRAALARLASDEYGICDECEEEIPEKRLRAMPFATRCRECQERAEGAAALRARRTGSAYGSLIGRVE